MVNGIKHHTKGQISVKEQKLYNITLLHCKTRKNLVQLCNRKYKKINEKKLTGGKHGSQIE
jgi:hypothetical protein